MSTSHFTAIRRLRLISAPPAIQHLRCGRVSAAPTRALRTPRPSAYLAPPFPFSGSVVGASTVAIDPGF